MDIVCLGSGNVAHQLGFALSQIGHRIVQVYSRKLQHAQKLATQFHCLAIDDLKAVLPTADLYVLAVSDDAIPLIVEGMTNPLHGIIVHTSGATHIDVLQRFTQYGVIYPPQSLSKHIEVDFSTIPFAIETNSEESMAILMETMQRISTRAFPCNSEQRLSLHLASVFANNFSNAMYGIAYRLLAKQDLPFDLVKPLILETAQKVQKSTPFEVQTGPANRNDQVTLKKHLDYLKSNSDWQSIYQSITDFIVKNRI